MLLALPVVTTDLSLLGTLYLPFRDNRQTNAARFSRLDITLRFQYEDETAT